MKYNPLFRTPIINVVNLLIYKRDIPRWHYLVKTLFSPLVNIVPTRGCHLESNGESRHADEIAVDEIARKLKKKISDVSSILLKLEIIGVVKNLGAGNYTKA